MPGRRIHYDGAVVEPLLLVALILTALVCPPAGAADHARIDEYVELTEIAPGVWWRRSGSPGFQFTANGILVITGESAVMVDTPWTGAQTGQLFDWVKQRFGVGVEAVIPTHYHADCMGGLPEAHRRGAVSYTLEKTAEYARRGKLTAPPHTFTETITLNLGGLEFELRYFGPAHTPDSFVVWVPARKVLFGGCLAKSMGSGKGNVAEADQVQWPKVVRRVMAAYPDAEVVVPGHGTPGGPELLQFTVELFNAGR